MRWWCKLALAALLAPAAPARADGGKPRWVRANFHAHAASDVVADDGAEPAAQLHKALRERGFDFSLHTPHSTVNRGPDAPDAWRSARGLEAHDAPRGLTAAVGEQLTVAPGPTFQTRTPR